MERQSRWYTAKDVYQQLLKENKYYFDAAIRLAWVWLQLGSYENMVEVFESMDRESDSYRRVTRPERFITPRAYLLHLGGSSSEGKELLKQLGKNKDIYSTILELCINYEGIIRKGVELQILKEFLRPNREFCYKLCREDHQATFGYMLLAIICLVDKKFTKSQGMEFFNMLKQFSLDEIPSILFNMAFFLLNYDEY